MRYRGDKKLNRPGTVIERPMMRNGKEGDMLAGFTTRRSTITMDAPSEARSMTPRHHLLSSGNGVAVWSEK